MKSLKIANMRNAVDVSLIIPTYNERDNIQILLRRIKEEFQQHRIRGEVIVVDDNSPDGTGKILEFLKKKYHFLTVIHREGKEGLSSAVLAGFAQAKSDVLGVMDADLSHPPEKINAMLRSIQDGEADFVIGSRYVKGGAITGWGPLRRIGSKGAVLLSRLYTPVKDSMSGFFMIKKSCVEGRRFNPKGFKILLELLVKAHYNRVKEIPITFVDRTQGKSKAGFKEAYRYLNNLAGYLPYKKQVMKEFVQFSTVGIMGLLVNLVVLYLLTEPLHVYYIVSAMVAFGIAVSSNYLFNKVWTFRERVTHRFFDKYVQFFAVSIMALVINLIVLYSLTEFAGVYYIFSQVVGIGATMMINFLGNKIWTFGH